MARAAILACEAWVHKIFDVGQNFGMSGTGCVVP